MENRNSLSVKQIAGLTHKELQKLVLEKNCEVQVCKIIGAVTGADVKETQYGLNYVLYGEFEAESFIDGKTYATRKLHLPASMSEPVYAQIKNGAVAVEFAKIISVVPNASMVYEYTYSELLPTAGRSALQSVKEQLSKLLTQ